MLSPTNFAAEKALIDGVDSRRVSQVPCPAKLKKINRESHRTVESGHGENLPRKFASPSATRSRFARSLNLHLSKQGKSKHNENE